MNPEIENYIQALPENIKPVFLKKREIILSANPEFTEAIKWKNCLTYIHKKKNLIQTVVGKDKVSLIFHNGAMIEDDSGWLEGDGNKTRTVRLKSEDFDSSTLITLVKKAVSLV